MYKSIFFILFIACIFGINCNVDPLSPEAVRGQWILLSFTDRFVVFTISTTTTVPGVGQGTDTERTIGPYTIDNSSLIIEDTLSEETKVFQIARNDFQIIIENDIMQSRWGKID